MRTIDVSKLINKEIRSRNNGLSIRRALTNEPIMFDFSGVTFISRSFADELYTIMQTHKFAHISGMSEMVQTMYDVVSRGREMPRVRKEDKSEIYTFKDLNSLSEYLLTSW